VIARAVLCPSPPLLARELTGRAAVLPELREACAAAVARLVKADSEVVVVVGGGAATRTWDPDSRLDLSSYAPVSGGYLRAASDDRLSRLPLALGLGALLLDDAGYAGPRRLQEVAEAEPAAACLRLGASLAGAAPRVGLLVVGDGSARRAPSAPGYFDERAAPFDATVRHAIDDGDMAALAALDPALARELMATGRAAWQVLAGALGGGRPATEILYSDDPFGVAYLVAVLDSAG
jgi:hypothetical protein